MSPTMIAESMMTNTLTNRLLPHDVFWKVLGVLRGVEVIPSADVLS